jgi:peroxiredoxin
MKRIYKTALVIVILLGLAVAFNVGGSACSTLSSQYGLADEAPNVGKHAPDFVLPGLDGVKIKLSDLRGKPVVVNFWATWCGYCIVEMPLLQQAYDANKDKGLVILAVNDGETSARAEEFIQANGYTFTVLLDFYGDVVPFYKVRGLPTTFFIDKEGVIRDIRVGAFSSAGQIEKSLGKIMTK